MKMSRFSSSCLASIAAATLSLSIFLSTTTTTTTAFLLHHPRPTTTSATSYTCTYSSTHPPALSPLILSAGGFGKGSADGAPNNKEGGRFNLQYGDEKETLLDQVDRQRKWENEYKQYIKRNGAQLCAMSWRGYQAEGRGAIFAKYDKTANENEALSEVDKISGMPSMYVCVGKWHESGEKAEAEKKDLQQILDRLVQYDPERNFVVVFQAHGLMGADIVSPNVSPPEMAERIMAQEKSAGVGGGEVITVDGHEVLVDKEEI